MVKLDNNWQEQQASFNSQAQNQQNTQFNSQAQNQTQSAPPSKGLLTLPQTVLQMVPWIPLALEAMTGQKVPSMGGTIGEVQVALQQIQVNLAQVLQSQAQIWTKLTNLESNAQSQFTNLNQQVQNIQSIRLTHSKESKAIEYNQPRPNPEENY